VPSKPDRRALVLGLILAASAADAQDATVVLGGVSAEDCAPFAEASPEILRERLGDQDDSALASLLIDAVARQCAAIGAIPPPERPGEEGTRSTTAVPEASEADRLAAEAQYLVQTAMQIDPDAANDLLRRLLGPRPGDGG
jgi:hypothetical protein